MDTFGIDTRFQEDRGRRRKDEDYDYSQRSMDDLKQQKSKRQIMLPKIQQGPTKADKLLQQATDERHREHIPHLPVICEAPHNDRELMYYDEPASWELEHQAKMGLVAKRMMQKYTNVNYQRPVQMASFITCDTDSNRQYLEDNGWEDNFDGYGYLYQRETAEISSTERERELDKKRQAMLELKDRQVKFFRKCKQQNLEAQYLSEQAQFYTEKQRHQPMAPTCQKPKEQSKRKKATKAKQGKCAKQNADQIKKEVRLDESQRNDFLSDCCKENDLPYLHHERNPPDISQNDSNLWFHSHGVKGSSLRGLTREENGLELSVQSNPTHNSFVQNRTPLPPAHTNAKMVRPLPPTCTETYTTLPALEVQLYNNSPLPSILQNQTDECQKLPSPPPALQQYLQLPLKKENQQHLHRTTSSHVDQAELSSGESSGSESIFELDTGNTLGIPVHVVTDEELRKELRLDLSFARTPVPKRRPTKQEGNDENAKQETKKHEDRS